MPMRRMLEGGSFSSKAVAILVEVFETVTTELDLRDIADRERAARIIIRLAEGAPALDEAELSAEVIRMVQRDHVWKGGRRAS
jgi:cytidylate kinase